LGDGGRSQQKHEGLVVLGGRLTYQNRGRGVVVVVRARIARRNKNNKDETNDGRVRSPKEPIHQSTDRWRRTGVGEEMENL